MLFVKYLLIGVKYRIFICNMKIKQTLVAAVVLIAISFFSNITFAYRSYAIPVDVDSGSDTNSTSNNNTGSTKKCGGVDTAIIDCQDYGISNSKDEKDLEKSGLWGLLLLAINIMTGLVGIVAVAGIVWGSFLYASANGSPEQVKNGITVIRNVIIGLFMYFLMFASLNFLIPGGVFK